MIVARASYLPPKTSGVERYVFLSMPAADEALKTLHSLQHTIPPFPVIIGVPTKRPGFPVGVEKTISEAFSSLTNEGIKLFENEIIQTGHSAGLMALEAGLKKLRHGAELCLIGGIDSYLEPETLEWLEESDQLHSSGKMNNAWGFVPGEAAGFCLLATSSAVRRHHLHPLAAVVAATTTIEANLIKTNSVCLGRGLTNAFENVLRAMPSTSPKIENIICDMNGEPYRADEYGFASTRVSEYFVDVSDFLAPADCWGDVGAASGPLFINLATAAWKKDYASGPLALLWTSSESGERSAVVLHACTSSMEN